MDEHEHPSVDEAATEHLSEDREQWMRRQEYQEHWHVDRRIPLILLFAIFVQTGGFIWWASATSQRVSYLESEFTTLSPQQGQIIRLQVQMSTLQDTASRIERTLDSLRRSPSSGN